MKNQLRQIKQVSGYEYDQNCVLGEGTYAKVYAGKRKANNMPVAVKVIKEQFLSQKAMKYLFKCEIQAARELSHPNIVAFFEVVREEGMCYIFMQKCHTKNLRSLIKKQGPLQETQALQIFQRIVNGYLYMTKKKVLHRDLKPSNILFRRNGEPLIADFGFCDFLDSPNRPKYYTVGSMNYMAPQSYLSQQYSEESDVWSLGVILYEMLKGHPLKMLSKKEQKHFKILVKTEYPIVDQNFSLPFINDLLKGCLATQKKKRISIVKLKEIIQKWREQNSIEANFCEQNLNLLNGQQTYSKQIKLIKIESQKNIEKIIKQKETKILRKASQKTFKPKAILLRPPSIATTTSSKKSHLSQMKRHS